MKSILVLALFVAVSTAAIANYHERAVETGKSLNKFREAVQPRGLTECYAAAVEIADAWVDCIDVFPDSLDTTEEALAAICQSTDSECSADAFVALLTTLTDECADSLADLPDEVVEALDGALADALSLLHLLCLQDDADNYCILEVANIVDTITSTGDITDATLEELCTGCIYLWWQAVNTYGGDSAFDLTDSFAWTKMCMKDLDKWCLLELQDLETAWEDEDYETAATIACETQCIARMAAGLTAYDDEIDLAMDILCYRNDDQDLCFPKVMDAVTSTDFISVCELDTANPTFSQECVTAVQEILTDIGCCWVGIFNALSDYSSEIQDILTEYNIETPDECNSEYFVELTQTFENIITSWVTENADDFIAALENDVALNTGISIDDIEAFIDDLTSRANTVDVTINIVAASTTGAETLADSINGMVSNNQYTLYHTAGAVPPSGRADITTAVSVSASTADTQPVAELSGNSASTLAVSGFLLVAAVLLV